MGISTVSASSNRRTCAGVSDEAPCFSADSRTVYFVGTEATRADATAAGLLYSLRLSDGRVRRLTSLKRVANFYGHYAWTPRMTRWCR